jgi:hypothetical protein
MIIVHETYSLHIEVLGHNFLCLAGPECPEGCNCCLLWVTLLTIESFLGELTTES